MEIGSYHVKGVFTWFQHIMVWRKTIVSFEKHDSYLPFELIVVIVLFWKRFSMVILTSIVVEGLKGHCLIKWWSRPRWRGQVYALCITLLSATGEIGRMGHYAMPSSAHTLCWGVSNTLRCLLDLSKVSLCFKLYSCCYFVLRHYFYFFELLNIWLLNTFWKINLQFLKSSFFVDFLYT